ncbi:hypothetical protein ACWDUN_22390 [Mycobacterium sp. NPDC003323]
MKKLIVGAIAAGFAAAAVGVAAPAQAEDAWESPWDFYGEEIIELPFLGSIRFVDGPDLERNFQGVKSPRGPASSPREAGNPSE